MNKPICSNKRFEQTIKSFKKYANKQIENNPHVINKTWFHYHSFDIQLRKLLNSFKSNPYKTKSGYRVRFSNGVSFWISYTVEHNNVRYFGRDFKDKILAFKIHMQIGNFRKERIACWKVKL